MKIKLAFCCSFRKREDHLKGKNHVFQIFIILQKSDFFDTLINHNFFINKVFFLKLGGLIEGPEMYIKIYSFNNNY